MDFLNVVSNTDQLQSFQKAENPRISFIKKLGKFTVGGGCGNIECAGNVFGWDSLRRSGYAQLYNTGNPHEKKHISFVYNTSVIQHTLTNFLRWP